MRALSSRLLSCWERHLLSAYCQNLAAADPRECCVCVPKLSLVHHPVSRASSSCLLCIIILPLVHHYPASCPSSSCLLCIIILPLVHHPVPHKPGLTSWSCAACHRDLSHRDLSHRDLSPTAASLVLISFPPCFLILSTQHNPTCPCIAAVCQAEASRTAGCRGPHHPGHHPRQTRTPWPHPIHPPCSGWW